MKDFKFLQNLPTTQQTVNEVVETPIEKEYLVYILTLEDADVRIGVPVASISEFDLFIAEHDVNTVRENLAKFNAIELK